MYDRTDAPMGYFLMKGDTMDKILFRDVFNKELKKLDGKKGSNAEVIAKAIVTRAKEGDVRAFETIRDTLGQKPVENIHALIEPPTFVEDVEK